MAKVTMNQAGLDAVYRQVAQKIEAKDASFRQSWEGKPIDEVRPHVAQAFGSIGVNLPQETITDYAAAVSARAPFTWKLT